MEKYLKQLQELDSEIFAHLHEASQLTIDMVQNTLLRFQYRDSEPIRKEELGSINYKIGNLLEIWNPAMEYDLEAMTKLDTILRDWCAELEE